MNGLETRILMIPADHPSAAGHFPGNPIIPGALLLDSVLSAMAVAGSPVIHSAKFLRPVRPGTLIELRWQTAGENRMSFECIANGKPAMTGVVATG